MCQYVLSDDAAGYLKPTRPLCYNPALESNCRKPAMTKKKPKTFEEAVSRLEAINQAMQASDMPLEDALAAYQEGSELVRFCQARLAEVEQKLQVLDSGVERELVLEQDE